MKKRLLSILLALVMVLCLVPITALATEVDVPIDEEHFSDANFRAIVKKRNTNGDDVLSATEISAVTRFKISNKEISDLTGIEYFTALTNLYVYKNQLTSYNNNYGLRRGSRPRLFPSQSRSC